MRHHTYHTHAQRERGERERDTQRDAQKYTQRQIAKMTVDEMVRDEMA